MDTKEEEMIAVRSSEVVRRGVEELASPTSRWAWLWVGWDREPRPSFLRGGRRAGRLPSPAAGRVWGVMHPGHLVSWGTGLFMLHHIMSWEPTPILMKTQGKKCCPWRKPRAAGDPAAGSAPRAVSGRARILVRLHCYDKVPQPGELNHRRLLPTVPEAGSLTSRCRPIGPWRGLPSWLADGGERALVSLPPTRTLTSSRGPHAHDLT